MKLLVFIVGSWQKSSKKEGAKIHAELTSVECAMGSHSVWSSIAHRQIFHSSYCLLQKKKAKKEERKTFNKLLVAPLQAIKIYLNLNAPKKINK